MRYSMRGRHPTDADLLQAREMEKEEYMYRSVGPRKKMDGVANNRNDSETRADAYTRS